MLYLYGKKCLYSFGPLEARYEKHFRTSFEAGDTTKDEFLAALNDVATNLDESVKILGFEPTGSTESKFCDSAKKLKSQLEGFIGRLEKL